MAHRMRKIAKKSDNFGSHCKLQLLQQSHQRLLTIRVHYFHLYTCLLCNFTTNDPRRGKL